MRAGTKLDANAPSGRELTCPLAMSIRADGLDTLGEGHALETILIIDDSPVFRAVVAEALGRAGHRPLCAADGREGLDLARSGRPALIVLDLAMPGMDGATFLRELRAGCGAERTPVIIVSAVPDPALLRDAVGIGVQDFLPKSRFSLRELLARVTALISPPSLNRAQYPAA